MGRQDFSDSTVNALETSITSSANLGSVLQDKDFMSHFNSAKAAGSNGTELSLNTMTLTDVGAAVAALKDKPTLPKELPEPLVPGPTPIDPDKVRHMHGVPLGHMPGDTKK